MKIAIIISYLVGGGSERFAVNLANGLVNRDHSVSLLTAARKEGEYYVDPRVNRKTILRYKKIIRDSISIRSFLCHEKTDVAIAIGIYPNLCCGLANFGLATKVILCERNDPVHDHLSWKTKALRRILFPNGDGYVFQTEEARDYYGIKVRERSVVIPNPIMKELPRRSHNAKKEFVAVGRLSPQKNYKMMIDAFSLVCKRDKDYILRIFGTGPKEERDQIVTQTNKLGLEGRVVLEGYAQDVHNRMINSDIYVNSSDFEGISNALMEAMAMGFPVVSTDWPSGGARMLIRDGENGLLSKPNDASALAKNMLYLIEHSDDKETMGIAAANVKEEFSSDKIINEWEQYTLRLINT